MGRQRREGLRSVTREQYLERSEFEAGSQDETDVRFVVDDEDACPLVRPGRRRQTSAAICAR